MNVGKKWDKGVRNVSFPENFAHVLNGRSFNILVGWCIDKIAFTIYFPLKNKGL